MKVDFLKSIWERFKVPVGQEQAVVEWLKSNPNATGEEFKQEFDLRDYDTELLEDTAHYLLPEENDGQATIEVTEDDTSLIYDNSKQL